MGPSLLRLTSRPLFSSKKLSDVIHKDLLSIMLNLPSRHTSVLSSKCSIFQTSRSYWEQSFVNPKNVSPVQLKGYFETMEGYYDATVVLDR